MSFKEILKNLPFLSLVSIVFGILGAFIESNKDAKFVSSAIIVPGSLHTALALDFVNKDHRIAEAVAGGTLNLDTKFQYDSANRVLSFVGNSRNEADETRRKMVSSIVEDANQRLLEVVTIEVEGGESLKKNWKLDGNGQATIAMDLFSNAEAWRNYALAKQLKNRLEAGDSNYHIVYGEIVQTAPRILRRALAFGAIGFALAWVLLVLRRTYRDFMQSQR